MSALWHPCTQMRYHDHLPPLEIVRGQGIYLYDKQGKSYLDMISSWWVNLHGHCHPTINEKIKQQLDTLEHTLLAGIVHPSVAELAEQLTAISPAPLTKVFFADSGSSAIEIALKMSLQFWQQNGYPDKTQFIALEHGYHGETIGSLSVTDIPLFSQQFQAMLVKQIKIPSPAHLFKPNNISAIDHENDCLAKLESLLEKQHQNICAMIVEPLVQGATGMAMYSANYLIAIAKLAKKFNIHLIFDEIAVGFGRTGTMFAYEQAKLENGDCVCPDFLCLSKGLTAGYLPMSCVLTTQQIFNGFLDEHIEKGFLHSHSFTGNPLASVASLASLQVFNQQNTLKNNQDLITYFAQQLKQLSQLNLPIIQPRQTGMIIAFTLDFQQIKGRVLAEYCLKNGVFIRPIGNHIYLMPPYCITKEQIDTVFSILAEGIKKLAKQQDNNPLPLPNDLSLMA